MPTPTVSIISPALKPLLDALAEDAGLSLVLAGRELSRLSLLPARFRRSR